MSDPSPARPHAPIWELICGWWRFSALHAWVELDCPDHLADGPLTTAELAARCGAHPPLLARLTRAMAAMGIVVFDPERDTCALTATGETLRSDAPGSMAPGIMVLGEELSWHAMGRLADTVRSGRSPVAERHGSLYEYYAARPELERAFAAYMTARSLQFAEGLLTVHDFKDVRTVVDVGGGVGTILAQVLLRHRRLRGVLLDLPSVTEAARAYLAAQGVADRCEVVAGSFLEKVPPEGEVYLLASILHNWPDETAVQILRTVREAMAPESRMLLLDVLLPDVPRQQHLGYDLDIRMLAMFGDGHERTQSAYLGLLERAGLRPVRTVELPAGPSLVEAVRS